MDFTTTTLKNGLKVVVSPMPTSPSVTVLVIVKTGSKYETAEMSGISHFLEHLCFKGTTRRPKAIDIARELDAIGADNNAFTAQEYTGYYAKAHPKHFGTILDVISDIYLNPTLEQSEIDKEKGVIIEEINMYEDMPHRIVHDVFVSALYGDQPAGRSILGTKENITRMTRADIAAYRAEHYVASATTVFVSGNVDPETVMPEIERAFAGVPHAGKSDKVPVVEAPHDPILKIRHKETDQTHLVIGVRTFSGRDKRDMALKVLNAVLGGGMSSRLFQKLREEMGVGYYVRSGTDEYSDHGYLAVSTGIDTTRVEEVTAAILTELSRLVTEPVSTEELTKAKEYLIGSMYLGLESSDAIAEYYAAQDIISDEMLTPSELAERVQAVTSEDVQAVARDVMRNDRLAMAIVGNIKNPENLKNLLHF